MHLQGATSDFPRWLPEIKGVVYVCVCASPARCFTCLYWHERARKRKSSSLPPLLVRKVPRLKCLYIRLLRVRRYRWTFTPRKASSCKLQNLVFMHLAHSLDFTVTHGKTNTSFILWSLCNSTKNTPLVSHKTVQDRTPIMEPWFRSRATTGVRISIQLKAHLSPL